MATPCLFLFALAFGLPCGVKSYKNRFMQHKETYTDLACVILNHTMTCAQVPETVPDYVTNIVATDQKLFYKGMFAHHSWKHVTVVSIVGNKISTLPSAPFTGLDNVIELHLYLHNLDNAPLDLFSGLDNLTVLSLLNARNMHVKTLQAAVEVPGTLPKLQELNFDSGIPDKLPLFKLTEIFVDALVQKPLVNVNVHRVILDIPLLQLLKLYEVLRIEVLNISQCVIIFDYNRAISSALAVESTRVLNVLDISGVTISGLGYSQFGNHPLLRSFMFSIENIYANDYDHFVLMTGEPYNFTEESVKWKTIHVRNNNLRLLNKSVLLNQNNSVQLVDLSENKIGYMCQGILLTANHLKYLYLAKNRLFHMQELLEFSYLFEKLHALEVIDLSENNLSALPKYIFQNNTNLKVLNLANNALSTVTFDLSKLTFLESLDLRMNRIYLISGEVLSALETYVNWKLNDLNVSVFITFEGNPLQCTCESLPFVRWLEEYMALVNIWPGSTNCSYEGKTIVVDQMAVKKTDYLCKRKMIIIVSVSSATFVLVIFSFTGLCVYKIRRSCIRSSKREKFVQMFVDGNLDQKFMAFVAYASEDEERVSRNFLINAENVLQRCMESETEMLRTGDHFRPGCLIVQETYRLIEMSCVFIAMVSNAFCTRDYCKAEIEEACNQHKPIILVFLEHVDESIMTPYLQEVFKRNSRAKLVRLENGTYQLVPNLDMLCDSIIQLAANRIER